METFEFEAIGTHWQIDTEKALGAAEREALRRAITKRIEAFDRAYSRFRSDSIVTQMAHTPGTYVLPPDAEPMLALYRDLYERTNGYFTPLVGNMLSDAGYDAGYSLTQKKPVVPAPAWNDIMEWNAPHLHMKKSAILDFGAAGKGYLINMVAEVIEQHGVQAYCIDAGGDILRKGRGSIAVGLEHPEHPDQAIGICSLGTGSICGSAGNRRAWGSWHHIVDPKQAAPAKAIRAVWVTAQTALVADALATCLFFVAPESLRGTYAFEYVIVREDYSVEQSSGFSGEVFRS